MAAVKIKFLPTMNMYRAGEDAAQYAKDALAAGLYKDERLSMCRITKMLQMRCLTLLTTPGDKMNAS